MKSKKMIIKGKIGSSCEHVQYAIEHDKDGTKWLYLTHKFDKLDADIMIGRVEVENNRGIKAVGHMLTGKPLIFYLDRQYFNFENL